ncbi:MULTISPECIES: hypothetical protein [Prochlorococcus]|uniref:Uncharacterized protein n=1 Tax=Prochlorococcus marinus (strain SARG / CCMP1375 / SS120) TaxID=167539 RepID=Q7VCM1_PROMA|nr:MULTISPECIES: hypothetical protein [Prochlorococcus]AAP99763.1 Predicted protein [Prochlorococcus marinus subsp. marinus str. CCMP1375]KGG12762.1 putative Sema domain [Prochlorococcus marinus str. LG]KGG22463.1 putative Sema domain [Prochlorococcus marinus str. SS2]KGG23794.1 putative Sema domain [Prochlorococcus marinus str. SS35]KGG31993.1 putative Sema domain [Prochlorococcus marinus str. SS51]
MRLIYRLFKKRKKIFSITQVNRSYTHNPVQSLIQEIKEIDSQIQLTSRAIFEAQIVRLRSLFSNQKNLFMGFQKRIIESSANTSAQWHQSQLIALNHERKKLQIELDKLTGRTWQRRFQNWWQSFVVISMLFISISFLIMGLFAALYLLPILVMLILGFLILNKMRT